jgi:DsbC/DsbD-like thiol-disulfide interchange protein
MRVNAASASGYSGRATWPGYNLRVFARRCSRLLVATVVFFSCVSAFAQSGKPQHLKISLVSQFSPAAAGGSDLLGLRFELEPGWHIYWTNPGDSGEPPRVAWKLPAGFTAGPLEFPTPHRLEGHSLTDYGYEGSVFLLSELRIPSGASAPANIAADVKWLVCREMCIPGKATVNLTLPLSAKAVPSSEAGALKTAEQALPAKLPATWRLSGVQQGKEFVLTLKSGKRIESADFIPAEPLQVENNARPQVRPSATGATLVVKQSEQLEKVPATLRGILIVGSEACEAEFPMHASGRPKS